MSTRQKMINLMYIVLTAMLALNVSNDVLNGFSQVEEGLSRSNRAMTARNQQTFAELQAYTEKNPQKGKRWLDMAREVRATTDTLYNHIDELKVMIVKAADGPQADIKNIKNRDNLDASSIVMLAPSTQRGKELRKKIEDFRSYITSFIDEPEKRRHLEQALSTEPLKSNDELSKKTWEESMFENMPAIAAVTLLSKLQNDLRYAEGEALNQLLMNVDLGDMRVNWINAFVIPQSRVVMRGSKYSAQIVLAAMDSTQRPTVFVNGSRLANDKGLYEVTTGAAGTYDYSGWIEVVGRDGTVTKRDFKSSYTVIDPIATVSASMMNVFYAGIDNPVDISVPGIGNGEVTATMTNGSLVKSGDHWVAHPTTVGTECVVSVNVTIDGVSTNVGSTSFRVRKLPDPLPYIAYKDANGNAVRFKGGRFSKGTLLASNQLSAAIDDDMLNIEYNVVSFETVFFDSMGNAIPEISNGAHFSERQKQSFRRLQHGKRFYITRIKASGPDGITRDIAPLEVIVN